jgi:DNA repair photolyase
MPIVFEEYTPRRIVNIHKHVDGPWFWGKYTAHPYVGCTSGCEFCYERSGMYSGRRNPADFDRVIRVKTNAVELLRKELPALDRDVISVGDWQQPAESRYRLSHGMLEAVRDFGFPLFIVERSPRLVRDLDLLAEINRQTRVSVLYSISTMDPVLKRAFEPRSPGVKQRLQAMKQLAEKKILAGTAMMPIIPFAGDDDEHLEDMIRATRDHGGACVVAGGMTMDGSQARRTLSAALRLDPGSESRWREMYRWSEDGKPSYSPPGDYNSRIGRKVRELCAKHGLLDRMPRYIAPGPLAVNKRIAERLFLRTYDLELEQADDYRIWAYRKAAWAVDEHPVSLAEVLKTAGETGLRALPGIGKSLATRIAQWLREDTAAPSPRSG